MKALALSLALSLAACRFGGEERREPATQPPIGEAERVRMESAALSDLAALEAALAAYVKVNRRGPKRLEDLVPKYIPGIAYLELGVPGHRPTDRVQVYPEGGPPGDTGGWGYAAGTHPKVFIDCGHEDSRGRAWSAEKGAF